MSDKRKNDTKGYMFEKFRLTLTHEIIDVNGVSHKLDLPLTVEQAVEHYTRKQYGSAVFINEMLDRMKEAVLNRAEITW